VSIALDGGGTRRLATLPAGSTFGELAVLGRATRTADVHAHGPVVLRVLRMADFDALLRTAPHLNDRLLRNMLKTAYASVDRMSREVASLGRGR
jgi:glutaminase